MKKRNLIVALASFAASTAAYADTNSDLFSSVQEWAGTGTNEAAMEIDWNNGMGNGVWVWGYRWDGSATGEQMLDAIVGTDPRLYAEVSEPTEYGTALFGLGYHASGDQNFQLSPELSFNSEHLAYTDYDGMDDYRTAVDAGDQWQEGWYDVGYWSYWISTDSQLSLADSTSDWDNAWEYSPTGMTERDLENGDVDGWDFSFYDGSGDSAPGIPSPAIPVPEPTVWAMAALGGLGMIYRKKIHGSKK